MNLLKVTYATRLLLDSTREVLFSGWTTTAMPACPRRDTKDLWRVGTRNVISTITVIYRVIMSGIWPFVCLFCEESSTCFFGHAAFCRSYQQVTRRCQSRAELKGETWEVQRDISSTLRLFDVTVQHDMRYYEHKDLWRCSHWKCGRQKRNREILETEKPTVFRWTFDLPLEDPQDVGTGGPIEDLICLAPRCGKSCFDADLMLTSRRPWFGPWAVRTMSPSGRPWMRMRCLRGQSTVPTHMRPRLTRLWSNSLFSHSSSHVWRRAFKSTGENCAEWWRGRVRWTSWRGPRRGPTRTTNNKPAHVHTYRSIFDVFDIWAEHKKLILGHSKVWSGLCRLVVGLCHHNYCYCSCFLNYKSVFLFLEIIHEHHHPNLPWVCGSIIRLWWYKVAKCQRPNWWVPVERQGFSGFVSSLQIMGNDDCWPD